MGSLKKNVSSYMVMTAGVVIICIGVYFFQMQNHFTIGGLSGLSVALAALLPISSATIFSILTPAFLILGFIFIGRGFSLKTVYCSLLTSLLISGMEWLMPLSAPLTDQPFLELTLFIICASVGGALVFNEEGSCGGLDVVAMIIKKRSRINIGRAQLFSDGVVAVSAFFLFDIRTGLFSVLGLAARSFLVDGVLERINISKYFTIISEKHKEISQFINADLKRGATICDCTGAYTSETRKMVLTVLDRGRASRLKKYVREIDIEAFMVIMDSSDVIVKDFLDVP